MDVLIVGAGPTGLALACQLSRLGTSYRMVDAKEGTSKIMKATALTPAALEFFEDLGFAGRVLELATRVRQLSLYSGGEIVLQRSWGELDSPYPFMALLGQNYTERLLYERLQELGGRVEWGTRLQSLVGRRAELLHPDGRVETLEARFVVGCDGGKSTVARSFNADYHDLDFATDYVVAELEIDGPMPREDWQVFFAASGPVAIGAMPHGRWGLMATVGEMKRGAEPHLEELQAIWNERSPFPARLSNPQWMSYYRTHAKVLKGTPPPGILLAGDAAHQVSPLSSLGMNSGLLDARNLAWKLHLTCRGQARPAVLESYHKEHSALLEPALVLSVLNEISYPAKNFWLRQYRDLSYRFLMHFDPLWRFYVRYQTQKDRHLRRSPIVAQKVGLPIGKEHLSDHGSCLQAWLSFGEGPHAGDPARDVGGLVEAATGRTVRLFEKLLGGRHTFLVFGGCDHHDQATRNRFAELEAGLGRLPEDFARAVFLHRGSGSAEWSGEVVLDELGSVHARYGAEGECLYLIRPDGFVGFRCQPPRWSDVAEYLERCFSF